VGCRQHGSGELCSDNDLNEDAHFVMTVQLPNLMTKPTPPPSFASVLSSSESDGQHDTEGEGEGEEEGGSLEQVYACVADGVGSWRQFGIDPKLYSHRLVENTQSVIRAESERRLEDYVLYEASHRNEKGVNVSAFSEELVQGDETVHPLDAIFEAWYMTNRDQHVSHVLCCAAVLCCAVMRCVVLSSACSSCTHHILPVRCGCNNIPRLSEVLPSVSPLSTYPAINYPTAILVTVA
jgi:hypothetical protein